MDGSAFSDSIDQLADPMFLERERLALVFSLSFGFRSSPSGRVATFSLRVGQLPLARKERFSIAGVRREVPRSRRSYEARCWLKYW